MRTHSLDFLNELPRAVQETLRKHTKPEEVAQQMEIATACAYALKEERIAKAKAECAARIQRKLAKNNQPK